MANSALAIDSSIILLFGLLSTILSLLILIYQIFDWCLFKLIKKEIINIIEDSQQTWDVLNIVYEKNDILVVEVSDPDGIKKIGKYSLWCFTYGKNINYYEWNEYSYNGIVYVIFDFSCLLSDPYFSMVLIKPFKMNNPDRGEFSLWDNHNEPIESNPKTFLSKIIGTIKEVNKVFTFKPIMDEFY